MAGHDKGLKAMGSTPEASQFVYNMSQSPPSFSPIRARKNDGLSSSPGSDAGGSPAAGEPVARQLLVDEAHSPSAASAAAPPAAGLAHLAAAAQSFPGVQVLGGGRSPETESEDEPEEEAAAAAPAAEAHAATQLDPSTMEVEPPACAKGEPASPAESRLRRVPTASRAGSTAGAAEAQSSPSPVAAAALSVGRQCRRSSAPPRLGRGALKEEPEDDDMGEKDEDDEEDDEEDGEATFIVPPPLGAADEPPAESAAPEAASPEAKRRRTSGSSGAAAPPEDSLVPADAGAPAESSETVEECALVPAGALAGEEEVASEHVEPPQLVPVDAGPARDSWGCCLPPEAADQWQVAGDVCSLQLGEKTMKLPRGVHDRLYSYQRQGVAWMWGLFHKEFGGILADEMGLGKTVQCAAFMACLKFTDQGSRFLVVAPVSLLEQWRRELTAWANETGLAVHLLHGNPHERKRALEGFARKGGAVLTSYDMVRNGVNGLRTAGLAAAEAAAPRKRKRQDKRSVRDDDSPSEGEEAPAPAKGPEDHATKWDLVVVDEGHQIKSPSCQAGKALRKLQATCRVLLTGTPLQNKLGDLWSLMDFSQPGLLGNYATFETNFSDKIAKGSKRNANKFEVELKDSLGRELKRLTAPHFLRRTKAEVATAAVPQVAPERPLKLPEDLPPKTDVVLWLKLTQAQEELYNLYLNTDLVKVASGSGKCGMEALRAIAQLKKLSNHPLLYMPQEEFAAWKEKVVPSGAAAAASQASQAAASQAAGEDDSVAEEATQPAPECQHVSARLRALVPNSVQGAALLSCKLRVLSVLLPQLHKRGHRCLIFSSSTRMLDLIQACVLRVLGLKFLRIDGTIEAKDRDLKLQKFHETNSKYFCMCLSVQTGGTGLTITGADRVILVDPAWNPSTDAQAIDRVHRIGQKKDVVVYRLICSGAIEDKMFRLQVFKRGMSKTYLEQEQQVRFFSHKELKKLFEPPDRSSSTQALMAEQIGTEALEHEELLRVVASDIGDTADPDALPFWQSSDVLGFSDYQRLFMFLEQTAQGEEDAVNQAKAMAQQLQSEEYVKDQVVENKWRKHWLDAQKDTQATDGEGGASGSTFIEPPAPLQDA